MNFARPVDDRSPVCANFMDWGEHYAWKVDLDTRLWIPKGSDPGAKGQHVGVDFDCFPGTVVSAMSDGIIARSRYENPTYPESGAGLYVLQLVQMHGYDAWWLKYSHLRRIFVEPGDEVKRGQAIGETGRSGNAAKPVLHVDLQNTRKQFSPIAWEL
jgi:murein DD-endopeptidase MepM/ murein hydrolase activator NlpD